MSSAAAEDLEDHFSNYPTKLKILIWMCLHGYTNCHVYHIEEEQLSLAQIRRLPAAPEVHLVRARQRIQ